MRRQSIAKALKFTKSLTPHHTIARQAIVTLSLFATFPAFFNFAQTRKTTRKSSANARQHQNGILTYPPPPNSSLPSPEQHILTIVQLQCCRLFHDHTLDLHESSVPGALNHYENSYNNCKFVKKSQFIHRLKKS
jgi:hypothetical protein